MNRSRGLNSSNSVTCITENADNVILSGYGNAGTDMDVSNANLTSNGCASAISNTRFAITGNILANSVNGANITIICGNAAAPGTVGSIRDNSFENSAVALALNLRGTASNACYLSSSAPIGFANAASVHVNSSCGPNRAVALAIATASNMGASSVICGCAGDATRRSKICMFFGPTARGN